MATGREHRALVEACRGLADRLDVLEAAGAWDDKAWREYRLALVELTKAVVNVSGTDPLADAVEEMRAEVRNTQDT